MHFVRTDLRLQLQELEAVQQKQNEFCCDNPSFFFFFCARNRGRVEALTLHVDFVVANLLQVLQMLKSRLGQFYCTVEFVASNPLTAFAAVEVKLSLKSTWLQL